MRKRPIPGTYEVWTQKRGCKAELLARLHTYHDVLAYLGYHAMREVQLGRLVSRSQGGFSSSIPSPSPGPSHRQYWFDIVMDDNVKISPELTDALASAGAHQPKPTTDKEAK